MRGHAHWCRVVLPAPPTALGTIQLARKGFRGAGTKLRMLMSGVQNHMSAARQVPTRVKAAISPISAANRRSHHEDYDTDWAATWYRPRSVTEVASRRH